MTTHISPTTSTVISRIFEKLDYKTLGRAYCYEGGDAFWRTKRRPCQRLGMRVAEMLMKRLKPRGRSLYVGAGVAEIPPLLVETLDRQRQVEPYNLRRSEVAVLNRACRQIPITFRACNASLANARFDHLWIVSVLNDPERFFHLAPLSYGRANPVTFDPLRFEQERRIVRSLVDRCMSKLTRPGLVTTSTEEVVWIAEWCHRKKIPYLVGRQQCPTALVGDPICFMRIGEARVKS